MNQLLWYYAELERQRCLEVGTNEILRQSCWTTLNAVSETACTQLIGQERQKRSGPWIKV